MLLWKLFSTLESTTSSCRKAKSRNQKYCTCLTVLYSINENTYIFRIVRTRIKSGCLGCPPSVDFLSLASSPFFFGQNWSNHWSFENMPTHNTLLNCYSLIKREAKNVLLYKENTELDLIMFHLPCSLYQQDLVSYKLTYFCKSTVTIHTFILQQIY